MVDLIRDTLEMGSAKVANNSLFFFFFINFIFELKILSLLRVGTKRKRDRALFRAAVAAVASALSTGCSKSHILSHLSGKYEFWFIFWGGDCGSS